MAPTKETRPATDPCAVTMADIGRLTVVHELLATLNDPAASAQQLASHAERFPPLQARIIQAFAQKYPNRKAGKLAERIALLGNRTLEAVLLQLLEDLTELQANAQG